MVYISVLSIPPQFISFPSHLQALEDVISPRFGGFSGIEIINSEATANISVTLVAHSGDVFLSPVPMRFWHPLWNGLFVNKSDGKNRSLVLSGRSEVINFALQSIQYLGNENFSGDDLIHVSTMNSNGINYLDIPIIVKPVNDPPFIKAPNFIVLKKNNEDGFMVFDKQLDRFDFFVGDPDLPNFPGNSSNFFIMFSVEVNNGFLSTTLPSELIGSTELKLKNSYQWQPLLTFVTISHHFKVEAKGIRFQGTVKECNRIMQQLLYHGEDYSAVLKLKVNDMGNYGCYPDYMKDMSASLFAEANVHLIKRRPMSSLVAHTIGSAIVVESILVLSLGILLLLFTCKCAIVLFNEKKSHTPQDIELSQMQSFSTRTSSEDLLENATDFTNGYPTPLLNNQSPKSPKRPLNCQTECGESSKHTRYSTSRSSSSDYDQDKTPLPSLKPFTSSNNF